LKFKFLIHNHDLTIEICPVSTKTQTQPPKNKGLDLNKTGISKKQKITLQVEIIVPQKSKTVLTNVETFYFSRRGFEEGVQKCRSFLRKIKKKQKKRRWGKNRTRNYGSQIKRQ